MTDSLDIIIVNWNSGQQLHHCLNSMVNLSLINFKFNQITIVDNASSDNSIRELEIFELPLQLMQNEINRGFAAACNQGACNSTSDYLLFLNPDTRLSLDSLIRPLEFLSKPNNVSIGIVGIQLLDDSGRVSRSCARFPTPEGLFFNMLALDRFFPTLFSTHFMTEWDHSNNRYVDQIMGAFFLVRRSLFEQLGGFDERFFVYFEEVDFALRARKAGWRSYFLAEAQAYHKGGGTSEQVKATRLFYFLRSRTLYCYKHFNWLKASCLLIATLLIEPLARVAWGIACFSLSQVTETLKGYAKLVSALPTIIKTVRKIDKIS